MERFTQRARRVLSLAQAAADALNSASIDTEHLLLGLMREDGGAGRVMRDSGLDLQRVEDLASQLASGEARKPDSQVDLSPGVKKSLEFAVDEARRLEHNYIGSEHLLLGLLRLQEGAAVDILRQLNVSRDQLRQRVAVELERTTTSPAYEPTVSYRPPVPRHFDYLLLRMSSRSSGGISHLVVDLSTEVKDALEEALKVSGHSGFAPLDERHLLLALLHNSEGALRSLLSEAGIDLDELIRRWQKRDQA